MVRYNRHHHIYVLRATRALDKFCREHHGTGGIRPIVNALEKEDFEAAFSLFSSLPPGPKGWADWFPPVVYEHEDGDYVWAVFDALVERWYRLMRLAFDKEK